MIFEVILIVIIIMCLLLWISYWQIQLFNTFMTLRNSIEYQFADIDVIMEKRTNTLYALMNVVKKYSAHEYNTIKEAIEARAKWTKDASASHKVEAFKTLDQGLLKVNAVFEKYPELKADELYQKTMGDSSVSEIEKELQRFRNQYNNIINIYNTKIRIFPESIVANWYGFGPAPYLKLGNEITQEYHQQYTTNKLFGE